MLLLAQRDLADGEQSLVAERFEQQRERLLAGLIRFEVVRAGVVNGVDLVVRDEGGEVDRVLGRNGKLLEVLVVDDDVLVFGVLIALDQFVECDFAIEFGAPAELLHRRLGLFVELAEADVFALGGGEEPHRDGDHAEAD